MEKIAGGEIEDCRVLRGVMFNKDVVAPGRMRRRIEKPRILLLDCPLEYKKGENQTNVEITKEEDWATLLKMEEVRERGWGGENKERDVHRAHAARFIYKGMAGFAEADNGERSARLLSLRL